MSDSPKMEVSNDDHQMALTEVSFLLGVFALTVNDLMGGATASVGRIAGREMAKKLPIDVEGEDLRDLLKTLAAHLNSGLEITTENDGGCVQMTFGKCAIRRVCENRSMAVGGELCRLFHYYLDGIINELHSRPVKSTLVSTGESCQTRMEIR